MNSEGLRSANDRSGSRTLTADRRADRDQAATEDNRAAGRPQAQPVYLTDDASGNLYIQSGRADIFFGPQSVAAYKAALNGQTRVVGLGPKKAWVATTTKKGNGLVYALQAALDGAIARGEYQQVLARWGEQGEAVAQSVVNPPGITY